MQTPEKLSKEVASILEARLSDEFLASYFYRFAANWCRQVGFFIAADFFDKESSQELEHAKGIENYLVDWNLMPTLPQIDSPKEKFSNIGDVISRAYKIEYDLYEAYEEDSIKIFKMGDTCTFDFLQKYRGIQLQSVKEFSDMINVLEGVNVSDKFQILVIEEKLFK